MTAKTTRLGRTLTLATTVALGLALLAAGCGDRSSSSSSSGSGSSRGLSDTVYWESTFSQGWSDSVQWVVNQGESAVPLLCELLRSKNETVVSTAAMALNELGDKGSAARQSLLEGLKNFPDEASVVATLKRHYLKDAVPELVVWLKGSNPRLQKQAATLMNGKKLGEAGLQAIPVLLQVIESDAPDEVRIESMIAIGSFGLEAEAVARPVLERVKATGSGDLAKWAHNAIRRIESARAYKKAQDWEKEQEKGK